VLRGDHLPLTLTRRIVRKDGAIRISRLMRHTTHASGGDRIETEERFRQFAELVDDAIFVADPPLTQIQYVNTRFETIWGTSMTELVRRPRVIFETVLPEHRTELAALFEGDTPGHAHEAVPLALVVNELGTNAIKRRAPGAAVDDSLQALADGLALEISSIGSLPAGFDVARLEPSPSGLGLVKALLPRRGARLELTQRGERVVARAELTLPALRDRAAG